MCKNIMVCLENSLVIKILNVLVDFGCLVSHIIYYTSYVYY